MIKLETAESLTTEDIKRVRDLLSNILEMDLNIYIKYSGYEGKNVILIFSTEGT